MRDRREIEILDEILHQLVVLNKTNQSMTARISHLEDVIMSQNQSVQGSLDNLTAADQAEATAEAQVDQDVQTLTAADAKAFADLEAAIANGSVPPGLVDQVNTVADNINKRRNDLVAQAQQLEADAAATETADNTTQPNPTPPAAQ